MHAFQGQDTMQPWKGSLGEQQSKPNIAVAFGREGGVKSNPTVALTLGRGVHLSVVSNSTVPLTFGQRRCEIQPNAIE